MTKVTTRVRNGKVVITLKSQGRSTSHDASSMFSPTPAGLLAANRYALDVIAKRA